MKKFRVSLNSIDSVKRFVNVAEGHSCEIDVTSGRYIVDGKSMLGLFSLDLSTPVTVHYYGEAAEQFCAELSAVMDVEPLDQEEEQK